MVEHYSVLLFVLQSSSGTANAGGSRFVVLLAPRVALGLLWVGAWALGPNWRWLALYQFVAWALGTAVALSLLLRT
jgi:hypothetical protein